MDILYYTDKIFSGLGKYKETEVYRLNDYDKGIASCIAIAAHIALVCVYTKRKVLPSEQHWYDGGPMLARYFDGHGEAADELFENYVKLVALVKKELYE